MVRRFMPAFFGLIVLFVMSSFQGCYTVLQMRSADCYPGDSHDEDYVEEQGDPYIDGYEGWSYPAFYGDPYSLGYYTGWYYSPWTYGYSGSFSTCWSSWTCRSSGPEICGQSSTSQEKGERRRGTNISDLPPKYDGISPGITAPAERGETTKQIRTLRRIDTTPESQPQQRTETHVPAMTRTDPVPSSPSMPAQGSSVSRTPKASSDTSKSSAPERRRGSAH